MKELGYGRGYAYNPNYSCVLRVYQRQAPYLPLIDRHPVHNDYLPIQFRGQKFLKEAGDMSGKMWDEDALTMWEYEENGCKQWEGRLRAPNIGAQ